MIIHFRTNLDLTPAEKWPEELPTVPRVGDLVESGYEWTWYRTPYHNEQLREKVLAGEIDPDYTEGPFKARLELAVVAVRWRHRGRISPEGYAGHFWWESEVELHLPPRRWENLVQFYEWYGQVTGRGKAAFI